MTYLPSSETRKPTPKEWKQILIEYRQYGLSQTQFCKENNLSHYALRYWLYKGSTNTKKHDLDSSVEKKGSDLLLNHQEFVEIDTSSLRGDRPIMELETHRFTLKFYSGADASLIGSVIKEVCYE